MNRSLASLSIGLILCQDRNYIIVEYALRGVNKPIGVSEYELSRALLPTLRSALPTVEEIEAELSESGARTAAGHNRRAPKARRKVTQGQPNRRHRE